MQEMEYSTQGHPDVNMESRKRAKCVTRQSPDLGLQKPLQNQAFFAPEMKGEYDWSTRCGIGGTEEENKTNDGKKEVCIIDKETMTRLRDKLRPKLIEYLDREQIPYDARTLIRCPHCGEQATAYDDGTWYCNGFTGCRRRGDVVDYAMVVQQKDEPEILRYLARMFGLKITEIYLRISSTGSQLTGSGILRESIMSFSITL